MLLCSMIAGHEQIAQGIAAKGQGAVQRYGSSGSPSPHFVEALQTQAVPGPATSSSRKSLPRSKTSHQSEVDEEILRSAGMHAVSCILKDSPFAWSDCLEMQAARGRILRRRPPTTRCWGPMTWADSAGDDPYG
ncbi:unnamed protein product [Polarella glacialis]|uniref:Uncharacterized protein n=1 Tax=Polarella glacialis TaxID=89957 RepID=A0A813I2N7_POLGL|nr:unnamed protein product [Polarella glacialis]